MALYISKGKAGLALLGAGLLAFVFWPFRCHHTNHTWPRRERREDSPADSYVKCNSCGKELPYDWQNMRILKQVKRIRRRIVRLQNVHSITDRSRALSLGNHAQDALPQ